MRALRLLLAGLTTLTLASMASASPVTFSVDGGLSSLSATVTGKLDVTVYTSLGAVSGTAMATGPLTSMPNGTIVADFGAPSWSGSLDVAAGGVDVHNPNPGSVNGNANLNLFGFIPVSFGLVIDVNDITLGLSSNYSAPTQAPPPGSGPWPGMDVVDLLIGANVDFSATGPFGIHIANSGLAIGPSVISGVPLSGVLSRTGGDPGTGSRLDLPISNLSLSLPPQPTSNFGAPGCEVPGPFGIGCAFNVSSVDVTLTQLTFSNVTGTIVALSSTAIVPEPELLGLLGLGALGLGARRRRRP